MFSRQLELNRNHSLFLFGARGTGKTTLLKQCFPEQQALWLNLLLPEVEQRYSLQPSELIAEVNAMRESQHHIVIDEIQKAPKLLDVVHHLIENTNKHFILTGSSARKLKYGSANLLAGRAFTYHLHPLSFIELDHDFDITAALQFGMLPKIQHYQNHDEKIRYLQAYAHTYLKEEVWAEHLIRKMAPFRKFLEAAAQCDGKELNYSNIARDTGVDIKTIQSYYTILEDTLLGFHLEAYQHSFRKRLAKAPKFIFFDVGVSRALSRMLDVQLSAKTSYYGELFERFIILECYKQAQQYYPDYRFCYLKSSSGQEIDLVIDRPGQAKLLIEIKSNDDVNLQQLKTLATLQTELQPCEAICLCQATSNKSYGDIKVYPWQVGIKKYFMR